MTEDILTDKMKRMYIQRSKERDFKRHIDQYTLLAEMFMEKESED